MEDASAVDLDWFWRGWFYSVDHVDVNLEEVKWFRMRNESGDVETRNIQVDEQLASNADAGGLASPEPFSLTETDDRFYGEFRNRIDDKAVMAELADKNFYQLKLSNQGGLVTPLLIEFTFSDGTKQLEKIPAEIWRYNEKEVTKVFYFDKQVVNVVLDPEELTGDTNTQDNVYPRADAISEFDRFKAEADANASANAEGEWEFVVEIPQNETDGSLTITQDGNGLSGSMTTEMEPAGYTLQDVKLEGNVLSFSFEVDAGGEALMVNTSLVIDGDLFKGKMNLPGMGSFDMMGSRK
jgi:hypothetical protein